MTQLYHGLVLANMNYCVSVWGAPSICVIKPLHSQQNKKVKSIFSPDSNICTISDYHSRLLLRLDDMYHAWVCKFVFKCLEMNCDTFRSSPSPYQTQKNSVRHLNVPFTTSGQTFKSIEYSGLGRTPDYQRITKSVLPVFLFFQILSQKVYIVTSHLILVYFPVKFLIISCLSYVF